MGNNLPIYPQNYNIEITCKPYDCPCEEKKPKGCWYKKKKRHSPKNEDKEPPLIGGCAGTEFGCCPDGKTTKNDPEGSNCPNKCGENILSTVGILPGKEVGFYNWNFIATYHLSNKSSTFTFTYDFTDSDIPEDNVIFEEPLQGTITFNGLVFDASKYINYSYNNDEKKVYFTFYQGRLPEELIRSKNTLFMNIILKHIPLEPQGVEF